MQEEDRQFSVTWRGNTFKFKMNPSENLKALGDKLQELTDVKAETLRLIVPTKKSSKLIYPFSDEHSHVSLETAPIHEGVSIRMMGVTENEVDEVIQNSKADLRIAGFDEEEMRMKRRMSNGKDPWKLPQGIYVFSEFRTLHLPGIELNPPASEALTLMHRLAADPGIVAIMNKHRWRVGIMTEMAPVGYVGVSPKCILGFNKNHGEEISLRLRTDDLNGFRKYDSIKKTLLHELAHMVHSEHNANFYALDKQLNDEAAALDWTKSMGHTLRGGAHPQYFEEEIADSMSTSKKLGGQASIFSSPRASSAAAAYRRFAEASIDSLRMPHVHEEPDPDESEYTTYKSDPVDAGGIADDEDIDAHITQKSSDMLDVRQNVPNPESVTGVVEDAKAKEYGQKLGSREIRGPFAQHHDSEDKPKPQEEPAPRNFSVLMEDHIMVAQNSLGASEADKNQNNTKVISLVTDPDDSRFRKGNLETYDDLRPVRDEMLATTTVQSEPDPDENSMIIAKGMSMIKTDEPDPDDMELERIQDPVSAICGRLQNAIEMLRSELNFSEASSVLERIIKIIKNAIEHPAEIKFRRLRKANPTVQRNVTSHKGAMEILHIIGFSDETIFDEQGKAEAYLVLKRNDPGLLWLAKTSLENSGT